MHVSELDYKRTTLVEFRVHDILKANQFRIRVVY